MKNNIQELQLIFPCHLSPDRYRERGLLPASMSFPFCKCQILKTTNDRFSKFPYLLQTDVTLIPIATLDLISCIKPRTVV
jgi:hypothetical protein